MNKCKRCGKDTGGEIWDLCPKCTDMLNYRFRNDRANESGYGDLSEFEDEYSSHYLTPEERLEALRVDVDD
jgi:hypothetical protein